MTDLETRVRDALHGEVAPRPADVLLDDVRRGARRRRTRRATSVAAVVALVVAGSVGFASTRHQDTRPEPSHRTPHVFVPPHGPTQIGDLAVSASGERFKALRSTCAGPCTDLWTQKGAAAWAHRGTIDDLTAGVTMAPDGRNGWASGMTGVWSTHDGGRTWARVAAFPVPDTGGVDVMPGPSVAWALLPSLNGAPERLWRSPVDADDWTQVTMPDVSPQTRMFDVLPDSRVELGDTTSVSGTHEHVVVGDGTTWHPYQVSCFPVPDLFGGDPSTRGQSCGYARTSGIDGQPLVTSHKKPNGSSVMIGAVPVPGQPIGHARTLYVAGKRAFVYSPLGRQTAHLALATHETIEQVATSGDHVVLSTSRDRVFASDDGGLTWRRLP